MIVTLPLESVPLPMPPSTVVGATSPTSPVIVPADVEVTVALTETEAPCVMGAGDVNPFTVRLVVVAWKPPTARGHCVARLATFTEPRPVARSYPVAVVHAGVVGDAGLTRTPLVPAVVLLQLGEVPAGEFAAQGTELFPFVTS